MPIVSSSSRRVLRFRRTCVGVVLLALCAGTDALSAQSVARLSNEPAAPLCFQPHRASACHKFMITELDLPVAFRRSGSNTDVAGTQHFWPQQREPEEALLGMMVNVNDREALGGALLIGSPGESRYGVVGRYRRWLGDHVSADLSAGPVLATVHGANLDDGYHGAGLTTDLALNADDLVGLSLRTDVVHAHGMTATGAYLGVRVGSYPAVAIAAGFGLLYAIVSQVDWNMP